MKYPKSLNIVTVSRLSDEQKAFFRALKIFKDLHDEGFEFHWNIIGDGVDRLKIERYIKEETMSDYVTLYGNQSNPYPYIKAADFFFLGSRYESWGIVMVEALTLGVPVVTTETSSAYEILEDKCFICTNNEQGIYQKLKFVLENKHLLNMERKKIENYEFDNESNKRRLMNMLKEK